jgi:hypothetical protein
MDGCADALVLFGATGDLVRKKLIPAIYELACAGRLNMPVIGVARSDWDDERLRTHARDVLSKNRTLGGWGPPTFSFQRESASPAGSDHACTRWTGRPRWPTRSAAAVGLRR